MKRFAVCVAVLAAGPGVQAQAPSSLSDEQAYVVYDQCLALAAGQLARTDEKEDAIYPIARDRCATLREALLKGHDAKSQRVVGMSSLDSERAASFPIRTKSFREMLKKNQPNEASK